MKKKLLALEAKLDWAANALAGRNPGQESLELARQNIRSVRQDLADLANAIEKGENN